MLGSWELESSQTTHIISSARREWMTQEGTNSQSDWPVVSPKVVVPGHSPERIVISMVLLYGDNGSELRSASASFAVSLSNRTDLSLRMNITLTLTMPTISPSLLPMPRSRNRRGSSPYWHRDWFPAQSSMPLETIDELVEGVIQGIATGRSYLNLTGTQIALETPVSNLDENQMSPAHLAWRDALCYSCY